MDASAIVVDLPLVGCAWCGHPDTRSELIALDAMLYTVWCARCLASTTVDRRTMQVSRSGGAHAWRPWYRPGEPLLAEE